MQALKLTKKYEKYPEYKDSGVEWLGDIPKGWEKNKLKRLFSFQSGDGFPDNLQGGQTGDVPFMKVSDINGVDQYVSSANNYVDLKMVKEKSWHLIPSGSILMPKIGAALSKNHRKVNTVPVCIDNNMLAVVPQNIAKEFGYWIWKMLNMSNFENISSVPSVNLNQLRNYSLAIPDTSEQKKIAKYLDEKSSYIDKIIEKKQKLVDLLKEKRSETINNSVTALRGSIEKIKYVAPERKTKLGTAPTNLRYIGLENIESFTGKTLDSKDVSEPESSVNTFHNGDVLFGKLRPYLAKVFSANFDGVCSGEFLTLVPNKNKVISKYLFYKLLSKDFIKAVNDSTYGTKMPRANWQFVGNQVIIYPSIDDQIEIVKLLDDKMEVFERAISDINRSIEFLQEFKYSLISSVVTGKIKV